MSSSTALLPKPAKKDDHPIFLRACHSPWISITQKILVGIRGFIASYMAIVFVMLIYYEYKSSDRGWLIPFELSNISYLLQVMYALTTFVRTFSATPECIQVSLYCWLLIRALELDLHAPILPTSWKCCTLTRNSCSKVFLSSPKLGNQEPRVL